MTDEYLLAVRQTWLPRYLLKSNPSFQQADYVKAIKLALAIHE